MWVIKMQHNVTLCHIMTESTENDEIDSTFKVFLRTFFERASKVLRTGFEPASDLLRDFFGTASNHLRKFAKMPRRRPGDVTELG